MLEGNAHVHSLFDYLCLGLIPELSLLLGHHFECLFEYRLVLFADGVHQVCACYNHIRDELVAGAFVKLPEQEQQILILHYVATMADTNIGRLMGMSRSAVQRHRTKALNELRKRLEDDGGRKAK